MQEEQKKAENSLPKKLILLAERTEFNSKKEANSYKGKEIVENHDYPLLQGGHNTSNTQNECDNNIQTT